MGHLEPVIATITLYGMDPKWVRSIFVVSMCELDQLTKMQTERVGVRLQSPMLKKRIWSRDHTRRPVMSQNAFCNSFFSLIC